MELDSSDNHNVEDMEEILKTRHPDHLKALLTTAGNIHDGISNAAITNNNASELKIHSDKVLGKGAFGTVTTGTWKRHGNVNVVRAALPPGGTLLATCTPLGAALAACTVATKSVGLAGQ